LIHNMARSKVMMFGSLSYLPIGGWWRKASFAWDLWTRVCVCVCVCMWVIKDLEKEELPPHMVCVMPSEIKRVHMHVSWNFLCFTNIMSVCDWRVWDSLSFASQL
jgi:hypothetical protein